MAYLPMAPAGPSVMNADELQRRLAMQMMMRDRGPSRNVGEAISNAGTNIINAIMAKQLIGQQRKADEERDAGFADLIAGTEHQFQAPGIGDLATGPAPGGGAPQQAPQSGADLFRYEPGQKGMLPGLDQKRALAIMLQPGGREALWQAAMQRQFPEPIDPAEQKRLGFEEQRLQLAREGSEADRAHRAAVLAETRRGHDLAARPEPAKPYSDIGKLAADRRAGLISAEEYERQLAGVGSNEATTALQTREGKIKSYIDQGLDRQTSMLIVDNNLTLEPTSDGRLVAYNPITKQSVDVTPQVQGDRAPIPQDPGKMTIAEAPDFGTGAASVVLNFLNRTYGQLDPEAVSRDVAVARPAMAQFKAEVRELNTIGGRPTNMQLETIDQIVPGTGILESPEAARAAMGQTRAHMIETHNRYQEALKSPALTGNPRVEMEMKAARLGQLIKELEPLALSEPRAASQAPSPIQAPTAGFSSQQLREMSFDELLRAAEGG